MKDLIEVINLIAVIQGLFLGTVLILRKKNKLSNILMALLLFSVSLSMSRWYFNHLGFKTLFYYMVYINLPFFLLHGPLIYLYANSITSVKQTLSKKDYIHFIPFIIYFSYLIIRFHVIGNKNSMTDFTAL